jgi:pyrroloquinoline quinone biosynthesis protein E
MGAAEVLRRIFLPWSHDSLLYEVTARCNLRCIHCYNVWKDDLGYSEEELDTDGALKLISKGIRESRCRQFTFTGGEPALRNDLERLVAQAASMCEDVALITNGTLLDETRVKSLIDAGVSLFELPLNSADRDMHNRMAGGIDCFDRVTRAAADIRYHGAELAFVFVGTSLNIEHWKDALELGIALGARGFLYNRYNAGGECHGQPEKFMPSVEQVREGLVVSEEYTNKYGIGVGASINRDSAVPDRSEGLSARRVWFLCCGYRPGLLYDRPGWQRPALQPHTDYSRQPFRDAPAGNCAFWRTEDVQGSST